MSRHVSPEHRQSLRPTQTAPAAEATDKTESSEPNVAAAQAEPADIATADTATAETAGPKETAADGDTVQETEGTPAEGSADGTPLSGGKSKQRKSTGGVPEHKSKKLNKKKSMTSLQLDCNPGDLYWARLKGYPPWPAIVCDEEMLPESLLASRPVSTARPDGSIRDDFKEGGKNAKDRTFPIMFLHTNEL